MSGGLLAAVPKALPLLAGATGYLLVAAGASAGTYWVASQAYGKEIASLQRDEARYRADEYKSSLDQFVRDSSAVHDAAQLFSAKQANFQEQINAINAAFDEANRIAPLPGNCSPDSRRMRSLADAIKAANLSIAGQRPSRPVSPTGDASHH